KGSPDARASLRANVVLPAPAQPTTSTRRMGRSGASELPIASRPEPCEILAGVVRRACQRRGGNHQEALGVGDGGVGLELVGRHETLDRMMLARRLQVLADRKEVDIGGAHVVQDLGNFVPLPA